MKKRLLAIGLSICLTLSMFSTLEMSVSAEDEASVSAGETVAPTNEENVAPIDETMIPGEGTATPTEEEAITSTEEGVIAPAEEKTNPADEEATTPVEIQTMDENGNITYIIDDVSPVVEEPSMGLRMFNPSDKIVNLRAKQNGTAASVDNPLNYTEYGTGKAGYVYGYMGADAAYLGTENGKVKFMISGVIGMVNESEVQLVSQSEEKVSSYYANGINLIHRIRSNMNSATTSSLNIGPQQPYMTTGATYYSYDGHYFYIDYSVMLADYRNNTRSRSINPDNPYYNYYQYLPLRSVTNYAASQLSGIINAKTNSSSKMWNLGNSLINNQNTYGVNALLMAGLAANESGWGTSSIAQSKNNLFGLNAVDSSPGTSANTYSTVDICVQNFAEGWMSKRYLNPSNSNYFGGFLGNKASGLNVKYASDPYWGEKAANIAWSLDSEGRDRYKYTLGVKDADGIGHIDLNVRQESNASSTRLFSTKTQSSHAFLILGQANGFYKVQSDPVLNSGRTAIDTSTGKYNFSSMYAYASVDYVKIVSGQVPNAPADPDPTPPAGIDSVLYRTHVEDYGWQDWKSNGEMSGTQGKSKRLEGIYIKLNIPGVSGNIKYRTHVQDYGWQPWKLNGEMSGTQGQSKRLEAIEIQLEGQAAEKYDIYYRVHAQDYGWLDWAKNGNPAGSSSFSKRLEGIEIRLVKKGAAAPGPTSRPYIYAPIVKYRTHVQTSGWLGYVQNGALSGTQGQAKRLEGIEISVSAPECSGNIEYQTHIQDYGWEKDWKSNGAMSGTQGKSKRLEAIRIRLTGEMAKRYDVYYRVHIQDYGWLGWTKNGNNSGSAGKSKRLECIQVVLVKKNGNPPGTTTNTYL